MDYGWLREGRIQKESKKWGSKWVTITGGGRDVHVSSNWDSSVRPSLVQEITGARLEQLGQFSPSLVGLRDYRGKRVIELHLR